MASATETMVIRIHQSVVELIDRAAKAIGTNRTEFILAAAHREAEIVLQDQCLFTVDGKIFDAFKAAWDPSPTENAKLRYLLKTPAPWDE